MKTMKAVAAFGNGKVDIVNVPIPSYGDYECLVRVTACGFCSSTDLKIIDSGFVADQKVKYPALIGHEGVGIIEKLGSKVRYLKEGTRIVCPLGCPVEGYDLKWAGMSEYCITHDFRAMIEDSIKMPHPIFKNIALEDYLGKPIPEEISDVDAVMILTIKENYSALKSFAVDKGKCVLIFGDGAIGMGLASLSKIMGASFVGIIGHHDDRLERIKRLTDVDFTLNSKTTDIENAISDMKFDIVIDAVGSIDIIKKGAKMLKPGGCIAVYGVLRKSHSTIDLLEMPNNVCIHMLNWPYQEHRLHDEVIRFVLEGKIDLREYYSHVMSLDDVKKGVEMIRSRQAHKVIFTI